MRDRVPFLLFRTSQASIGLANRMLAEVHLTARQVGVLTLVTERGPMTQTALGRALQIDRTTMVELIDDLESKGYLERQRAPSDRRAYLITPTAAGQSAKKKAVAILDRQQALFLEPLSGPEREVLAEMLDRLFVASQRRGAAPD